MAGGERAAARRLLDARKDDATLDYARALLDEAEGHAAPGARDARPAGALAPTGRTRARAAVRAVELRLRIGGLTAGPGGGRAGPAALRLARRRARTRAAAARRRAATPRAASGAPPWRCCARPPAARSRTAGRRSAPRCTRACRTTFAAALAADARTPLAAVRAGLARRREPRPAAARRGRPCAGGAPRRPAGCARPAAARGAAAAEAGATARLPGAGPRRAGRAACRAASWRRATPTAALTALSASVADRSAGGAGRSGAR